MGVFQALGMKQNSVDHGLPPMILNIFELSCLLQGWISACM